MYNGTLFGKYRLVAGAYCVYVYRNGEYVLDYPHLFVEYDDAVNFMRETYGTDMKPLTEEQCHWFEDSNGNRFFIGFINTYGRK